MKFTDDSIELVGVAYHESGSERVRVAELEVYNSYTGTYSWPCLTVEELKNLIKLIEEAN